MTPPASCTGVVLVVDDDEDTRELLATVLRQRGYRVAMARDGDEALALLRGSHAVCFVLLDLFMPGIDGLGVLQAMNSDPRLALLPVCISTSAPDAVPKGVACLPKPTDLNLLFAMIERNCHAQELAPPR